MPHDQEQTKTHQQKSDPPLRLLMSFHQAFDGQQPHFVLETPGRKMWIAASPGQENFAIHAPDLDGRAVFSWQSAKRKRTVLNRPLPGWARYPAGVIVHLCGNGMDVASIKAVIVGDEKGMRYEYSLGVAVAALWHHIHRIEVGPDELVEVVERARREYGEG